ncbi:EAL domain-containing protein [Photobacterium sp. SDRW27]|uniref:sensor domain-containing protein n=1 Tax=Photobacterium obscurum TaxID=2829490 RepID=UPI002244A71D|nr:bifunctional diguanylate cyclase/phosphodiesterase [Photobacterium obscurum]MCW8327712.1 EAL domain-containing protein [Photobacterium obscurum]
MKVALLRFLALLLPLLSITAAASFYIYHEDVIQLEQRIQERERSLHQSSLHITRLHFAPIIDDLRYLTQKAQELSLTELSEGAKMVILASTFRRLADTRSYYDQVRLIDANGMEIIRVNQSKDGAVDVREEQLQDKSHRPYVQNALKIQPGSFYTSQFDLNMENGKVEVPSKPMLRFVSHFVINGDSWLISLNYLGADYLLELNQQYNWNNGQNWLVNNKGQWLLGPETESAWQFMGAQQQVNNQDFFQAYGQLWEQINESESGQIREGEYLYTFTRFFSGDQFLGEELFTLPFDGTDLPWTIISRVNMTEAVLELAFSQQRIVKFAIFSILIMALVSGCMVLAWHLLHMLRDEKKLKEDIEDVALKYSTVLKHARDGLITISDDMTINSINKAAGQILNINEDTAKGKNLLKLVTGQKTREQIKDIVQQVHEKSDSKTSQAIKARIQLISLKPRHIEFIASETFYHSSSEILLNIRDITYWIEREEKLKSMSRALEQSNDSIIITNNRGIIEYVNQSFENLTGVKSKDIIGAQSSTLLKRTLDDEKEARKVQEQLKDGRTVNRVIARRQQDNSVLYEEKTISPIRNSRGKISHYISTGKDITERVLFESKLHKLAHYDLLTELPNRTLLQQFLETAIQQAKRTSTSIALLTIDLDHFKQVNDSLGHDIGDKVLLAVAKRINGALREDDTLARLGGDEFAIIIKDSVEPANIITMANRILRHISKPLCIDSRELFIAGSIGISISPDDTDEVESLLKQADIALYRAKEEGRNKFCFYTQQMGVDSINRMQLESELRRTIGTSRYHFYYQPKVNAITHDICGVEALLRWENENGDIQSPLEIIPILEHSGLIIDVGEYLIHSACEQLVKWRNNNFNLHFALNISARQLLNSNIVETVQKAISETGCDPQSLELEITESVIMSDVKIALDKLIKLEALGVKIAIDDFGTGYSSLAYLSRFPIHILKVDREFVKDLPRNKDNITITRSIVELAHNLNMRVVAEGVETEAQEKFLASLGVEEFQGYYFGRPMPQKEFELQYLSSPEDIFTSEKVTG